MDTEKEPLLQIEHLQTCFFTKAGVLKAVDDVSITIPAGKTVGLVGESGCGKSMTAMSVMGLVGKPGKVTEGRILYRRDGEEAQDLLALLAKARRQISGDKLSMIFQEPMTSLNPVMTVGKQVRESLLIHEKGISKEQAKERVLELFRQVGIPDPARRYASYPHQLSGGLRQRVMIAMAMACNPDLLIADEPTTALDVTIQAQILDLLRNLKDQINSSIMFITHDLGVIAEMADYVVVMYAGRIVEQGTAEEIFAHPAHPYTIGLMASKPVVGRQVEKLYSIPGKVPNPINMPNYCYFKDRCEMCVNGCEGDYPCEVSISPTHKVSCYRYYDGKRPDLEEIVEEELAEGKENGKEGE